MEHGHRAASGSDNSALYKSGRDGAKLTTSHAHAHLTVPSESLPQTSETILLSESSPAYIWLVRQFRRP